MKVPATIGEDHKCPRLWEVEAVRGDRLRGAERAAWERHAAGCAQCTEEARGLAALTEQLRTLKAPPLDELSARRMRQGLLSRVNEVAVRRRPARAGKMLFAVAVAALVVIAGLSWWRPRELPDAAEAASAEIDVRPSAEAVWSRAAVGTTDFIDLQSGALAISVRHRPERQRVIVRLPDGELEDRGTVFRVVAAGERTVEVVVIEGSVELRLRDRPLVVLSAGDVWRSDASAARPEPASEPGPRESGPPAAEPAPVPAVPSTGPRAERKPSATAGPQAVPSPGAGTASAAPGAASDPATAHFGRAMAALRAGAHGEAAEAFRSFRALYPRDPRAEDAAYLRVVALSRAGKKDAAQTAAEDYKTAFPQGFRGREVTPLAPSASPR